MSYARWENKNEIKQKLNKIKLQEEIESSGLPVVIENDNFYITNNHSHSLIVGATGSGKTQALILPLIKLSMLAGESLIVNDIKGELYKLTANSFKERGYETLMLDFNDAVYGNYWNPLTLPYNLYKEGNTDKTLNLLEEIGYYLFSDIHSTADPFWTNSTVDYFTGLCLYLFKNHDKEANLNDVFSLANKLMDDKECDIFLKEIGKSNAIYYNVSGTLTAPKDTKGGIFSTFNQKLKKYISKENLSNMMSKSDFDINTIANKKTVVYIVREYNDIANNIIPLFINQVFESVNIYGHNKKQLNIILDEFDSLLPIRNFSEIINYSRSLGIIFTVVIKSYLDLINTYGKENSELIKLCFGNFVYLYANDIYTLEEISKLCGNKKDASGVLPLATMEDLKSLDTFEAVFLLPRLMPYKGKMIPDYKIEWNFGSKKAEFVKRK